MMGTDQRIDDAVETSSKWNHRNLGLGCQWRGFERANWNSRLRSVKVTSR